MAIPQLVESQRIPIGPVSLETDQPISFFLNTSHGPWLKWEVGKAGFFSLQSNDLSQNTLAYKAIKLPKNSNFNPTTNTFTWHPTIDDIQVGVHILEFEVTNGQITAVEQVMITLGKKERMGNILSRYQHAQELARIIADKRTSLPLAIGIYNSPGEGKSFLLDIIEDKLDVINKSKDKIVKKQCTETHTVRFDASEYEDQEKIWFSQLKQLFTKYEEEAGSRGRNKYRMHILKKLWIKHQKTFYLSIILIILLTLLGNYILSLPNVQQTTGNWQAPLGVLIYVAAILSATVPSIKHIVIPAIKKTNTLFIKPTSKEITDKLKYPDYKSRLGTREEIKESLNDLIKLWIEGTDDRIVIMVDHLDYCAEETIQEFFDAMHLFVSNKSYQPISFIIPLSLDPVCLALANKNLYSLANENATREEKIAFGKGYLESYITLPYKMPKVTGYDQFIDDLLPDLSNDEDLYTLLKDREDSFLFVRNDKEILKEIIFKTNLYKSISPAEIKKIINLFLFSKEKWKSVSSMKRNLNFEEYKNFNLLQFRKEYISWFLFEYFYPSHAKQFAEMIESVKNQSDYNNIDFQTIRGRVFTGNSISSMELNIFFKELDSIKLANLIPEYISTSHKISVDLLNHEIEAA